MNTHDADHGDRSDGVDRQVESAMLGHWTTTATHVLQQLDLVRELLESRSIEVPLAAYERVRGIAEQILADGVADAGTAAELNAALEDWGAAVMQLSDPAERVGRS